jgi:SAM-dependent methyltransferase
MREQNIKNWTVSYPRGMVKYIDFFREKFCQYDIYDKVVNDYIERYASGPIETICSLGAGTGRHENTLAEHYGYKIIGLEQNKESIDIANERNISDFNKVKMVSCNFLDAKDVEKALKDADTPFDCVIMLFISVSLDDQREAMSIMKKYLKKDGLFIVDILSYEHGFSPLEMRTISDNDYAPDPFANRDVPEQERDFCMRMNFYQYKKNIIEWTAIYFYNEEGQLKMQNDHDTLEVMLPNEAKEFFEKDIEMEALAPHIVTECGKDLTPVNTMQYIIGLRKK